LELTCENIIHLQTLGDLPRDVEAMGAPGIHIDFLQQNAICVAGGEEIDNPLQFQAASEESAPMPVIVSVRTVVVRSGIASFRTAAFRVPIASAVRVMRANG